jgi:Subtilase family
VEDDMTESADWRENVTRKVLDETNYIVDSFAAPAGGEREIKVVAVDGGIDFIYAEGQILVREEHLEQVLQILEGRTRDDVEQDQPRRIRRVIEGVVLLTLPEGRFALALDALDEIDGQIGRGVATPNHVVTVSGGSGTSCPATEPEEVYYEIEPFPSVCHDGGGAGVLIYLADTGLLRDAATHSWLAYGVWMGNPAEDVDPHDPLGNPPVIPPYAGHGTFVAGVMRCMAPQAQIIVTNAFSVAGSQLESDVVPRLESALGLGADIFHLTIACLSRYDLPLIAFEVWLRHLRHHPGAICVAAAGNCGFDRPEWPAAFPGVIAVGALGGDWRGRATFSNFGPWVDVYAPGRDLVNAFATGTYRCYIYPYGQQVQPDGSVGQVRDFYGMAKWSGTSFSTPIVTGRIASRMSRTGETARQAAAALLAEARSHAIPGVGPVLLPRCGDAPDGPECCCHAHRHRHDTC